MLRVTKQVYPQVQGGSSNIPGLNKKGRIKDHRIPAQSHRPGSRVISVDALVYVFPGKF